MSRLGCLEVNLKIPEIGGLTKLPDAYINELFEGLRAQGSYHGNKE